MIIDFSKTMYEPRWYDFETGLAVDAPDESGDKVYLKIRPYPASHSSSIFNPDKGMVFDGKELCGRFKHCLIDWRNVVDAQGKKLACSDEVKQLVFDFNLGEITAFVTRVVHRLDGYLKDAEKN